MALRLEGHIILLLITFLADPFQPSCVLHAQLSPASKLVPFGALLIPELAGPIEQIPF